MSPILGVKVSIDFENENDHVSRESLEMSQPAMLPLSSQHCSKPTISGH